MKRNYLLATGIAFSALFLLSSCLKNKNDVTPQAGSFLVFLQASPDAEPLDIYFNGKKVGSPLKYPQTNRKYEIVDTGFYNFAFARSGTGDTVVSFQRNLLNNEPYTLVLYDSASKIKPMFINDDLSNTSSTASNVRFFHLSPDAEPVDVYFDSLKVFSGRSFADNVPNPSFNSFSELDQGTYLISVLSVATGDTLVKENNVDMPAGYSFTLFLRGLTSHSDSLGLELDEMGNFYQP